MPRLTTERLTVAQIQRLIKAGEPLTKSDGNGLTFRIAGGSATWTQRVSIKGHGQVSIGLGPYPRVGLAEARDKALDNVKLAKSGIDPRKGAEPQPDTSKPAAAKPQARRSSNTAPLFRDFAEKVMDFHLEALTNPESAYLWRVSIRKYANPHFGDKPVDEITTADILAALRPIWYQVHDTAKKCRAKWERIFNHAIVEGLRLDNPAPRSLVDVMPQIRAEKKHHEAADYASLPAVMAGLDELPCDNEASKLAFEWVILHATRANETLGMEWSEIDFEARKWVVPAKRMKRRIAHEIPLSDRAFAILNRAREVGGDSGIVFKPTSRSGNGRISDQTLRQILERLAGDGPTMHGTARSGFRDWCAESKIDRNTAEAALHHTTSMSDSEASYYRTTHFEERRAVMERWADFLRPA